MRFDGYYLLSDYLDVPNLQDRAFALGRWRLREFLFGWGEAQPEAFPPGRRRVLLLYAYATWIYRLVLFLGIALLVYHFFFKLLGILLFAVEIWYFVTRPVALELRAWWNRRAGLRWNSPTLRSLTLLGLLIAAVLVPWRTSVSVPAILEASGRIEIFPPAPARVEEILARPGDTVAKGQLLYRLSSPGLAFQRSQAEGERTIARIQEEQLAVNRERASEIALAHREAIRQEARIRGIAEKTALLDLVAPAAGRLVDVPDSIRIGQWLNETERLGLVVAIRGARLVAYAEQEDLEAIREGAGIAFFPEDPLGRPLAARVDGIAPAAREILADPLLASVHGGSLDVSRAADGTLRPVAAIYRVTADVAGEAVARPVRGTARIEGPPRSLAARLLRGAAMVLLRESGF
jgi:putative peptide zinc metalloprotease protein